MNKGDNHENFPERYTFFQLPEDESEKKTRW
jgi:hypothetical protein